MVHPLPVLVMDEEYSGYCYCHADFPEFTSVRKPAESWTGVKYFMLASPFFSHPNWWTGYFYYHQTMIRRMPDAYSDHLWIPAPSISTLRDSCRADSSEAAHSYAYYLKYSIECVAMMFELRCVYTSWVSGCVLRVDGDEDGPGVGEEGLVEPVVAGGGLAVVLHAVEDAFDHVPPRVRLPVAIPWGRTVSLWAARPASGRTTRPAAGWNPRTRGP